MVLGGFPVAVVLRWLGDIWVDDLPDDRTLGVLEVLARYVESEEYPLSDESEEEVRLPRYRVRFMDPEWDHEHPCGDTDRERPRSPLREYDIWLLSEQYRASLE